MEFQQKPALNWRILRATAPVLLPSVCPFLLPALLNLHSVSIGDFKVLVYIKDNTDKIEFAVRVSAIPLFLLTKAGSKY